MRFRRPERGTRSAASILLVLGVVGGCTDELSIPSVSIGESAPEPLESITRPAEDGTVHLVRLVQRGDRYAFEPAELTIPSGDVVRFVMAGSQPESVVFEAPSEDPEIATFIRSRGLQHGVLLTDAGQAHDVSFRDAPPGRYPFLSLPHASQGMRGAVTVQ